MFRPLIFRVGIDLPLLVREVAYGDIALKTGLKTRAEREGERESRHHQAVPDGGA